MDNIYMIRYLCHINQLKMFMIKKEDAYKELVGKMTANGEKLNISDRTINENLETLMTLIATDDMELNDFVEKVLPILKTADSNARADNASFVKSQQEETIKLKAEIEELKKSHTPPAGDDKNKDLLDRLTRMEQALSAAGKEKENENKRRQLAEKLKDSIKNEKWIQREVNRYIISDDFDLDKSANEITESYNIAISGFDPNVTPHGSGASSLAFDKEFEDIKKAREEQNKNSEKI